MDALVRFYEGEWVYLAKAEYGLRSVLLDGFKSRGSKEVPACAGMTTLRCNTFHRHSFAERNLPNQPIECAVLARTVMFQCHWVWQ